MEEWRGNEKRIERDRERRRKMEDAENYSLWQTGNRLEVSWEMGENRLYCQERINCSSRREQQAPVRNRSTSQGGERSSSRHLSGTEAQAREQIGAAAGTCQQQKHKPGRREEQQQASVRNSSSKHLSGTWAVGCVNLYKTFEIEKYTVCVKLILQKKWKAFLKSFFCTIGLQICMDFRIFAFCKLPVTNTFKYMQSKIW